MYPIQLDDLRRSQNLLTIDEVIRLIDGGNRIYDPYSVLISARARIGSGNQFGEGGFTAKANQPGARIQIGDKGRYQNGACADGETELGSGSESFGAITVDSCRLEAGDCFRDPGPDLQAGLLKGSGVARNIAVPRGQVIVGAGGFSADEMQPQSDFHPKH